MRTRRLAAFVGMFLVLSALAPLPAPAHSVSGIASEVVVTNRWRTRGGTGFAIQGYLDVTNKTRQAQTVRCTLVTEADKESTTLEIAPRETSAADFFMSTWRLWEPPPKVTHCHRS